MILQMDNPRARQDETDGEAKQRQQSLLLCLRRMGFYDPESLLGLPSPGEQRKLDTAATRRGRQP